MKVARETAILGFPLYNTILFSQLLYSPYFIRSRELGRSRGPSFTVPVFPREKDTAIIRTHVRQVKEVLIEIDSETFPDVIRLRGKTSS